MEAEKYCKHCQKPLHWDFHFCPYCGVLNLEDHEFKLKDLPTEIDEHENLEKLDVLEASLDVLDIEISQFLSTK